MKVELPNVKPQRPDSLSANFKVNMRPAAKNRWIAGFYRKKQQLIFYSRECTVNNTPFSVQREECG